MVTLTLLESGRRGTKRRGKRRNPTLIGSSLQGFGSLPGPAPVALRNPARRPMSDYQRFVHHFSEEHPGLKGPELISRAAAAWGGHEPMAKSRRSKHHRRNPTAMTVANPKRREQHRKHRRRNPIPGDRMVQKTFGVSIEDAAAAGIGVVVVEMAGNFLDHQFASSLQIPSTPPAGFDFMYMARKVATRFVSLAGLYYGGKMLGVKGDSLKSALIGGGSDVVLQLAATSHLFPPNVIAPGSLHIGAAPAAMPAMQQLPPPPPMTNGLQQPVLAFRTPRPA